MKVGILTFHWATNHGAVLQTYASLCCFQKLVGKNNVFIIDYYPEKYEKKLTNINFICRPSNIFAQLHVIIKEKRIKGFRNRFNLTKRYYSNEELINDPPQVDVLVCGSDQIWNASYLLNGEGKQTPVYFLNFGDNKIRKVALSASFGCIDFPESAGAIAKPFLNNFQSISVRENSGTEILKKLGIQNVKIVADPSILLSKEDYLDICKRIAPKKKNLVVKCILRSQSLRSKRLISNIFKRFNIHNYKKIEFCSVENWLASIRDAKLVVTNSFHCIMLCLKLNTPFIAILEDGSNAGMNDRIITLLTRLMLKDRIIGNEEEAAMFTNKQINWENTNSIQIACFLAIIALYFGQIKAIVISAHKEIKNKHTKKDAD